MGWLQSCPRPGYDRGELTTQKVFRQILVLLILAAIPATGAALLHPKRPSWREDTLAPGEILLQTALDEKDKVLWLDARPAADFQQSHIPGAMLLNEDNWDNLLPQVLSAWRSGKIVVVYCSSMQCQAGTEVARRLREEAKLPDVHVLKGGWEAWLAAKK
jgi:rhodanese-related sulfurtransferase